ncbi:MAG: iron-sulfur cluster assembly scaffold protein [Candidatus Diapherotrites archaeon]|nr:iron-sulfur cluster assembly scaffold protein [Candidatus Diapherotrites archaeon]
MDKELYSELILDLYKNPVNFGQLRNPDLHAEGGNPLCGDQVTIDFKLGKDKKIQEIKFSGQGCAISMASASLLTSLAKGKTISEVLEFTQEDVFENLGQIIETRIKCALVSLKVLKDGAKFFQQNPEKNKLILGIKI